MVTRTARKNDFILYSYGTLKVSMKRNVMENGMLAKVFKIKVEMVRSTLRRLVNIACKTIVSDG